MAKKDILKKSISKQKGGYLRKISNEKINYYRNKHRLPNDCCPCVMSFFGENEEFVDRLFDIYGPSGMTEPLIQDSFKNIYPNYNFEFKTFSIINSVFSQRHQLIEQLNLIYSSIPNNYGLFGGYKRQDSSRHCVAFAKDNNGIPWLIDAQTGQVYIGEQYIFNHLWGNGLLDQNSVVQLYYLHGYSSNGQVLMIDENGVIENEKPVAMEID